MHEYSLVVVARNACGRAIRRTNLIAGDKKVLAHRDLETAIELIVMAERVDGYR